MLLHPFNVSFWHDKWNMGLGVFQENRTCIYGHRIEAVMSSTINLSQSQTGENSEVIHTVSVSFSPSVCLPVAPSTAGTDDKFPLLAHHKYTHINAHKTYPHQKKNPLLKP